MRSFYSVFHSSCIILPSHQQLKRSQFFHILANTCYFLGGGCFGFLLSESRSVVSNSLWPHGLYSPWNSPGKNTRVDSLSLLQGIFPTQGLNLGLPHCRWIFFTSWATREALSPKILSKYGLANTLILNLESPEMWANKLLHLKSIYLFIWLGQVLVAAWRIFPTSRGVSHRDTWTQ